MVTGSKFPTKEQTNISRHRTKFSRQDDLTLEICKTRIIIIIIMSS
jgi:hypothetical protein